jgi:hypothetical protein
MTIKHLKPAFMLAGLLSSLSVQASPPLLAPVAQSAPQPGRVRLTITVEGMEQRIPIEGAQVSFTSTQTGVKVYDTTNALGEIQLEFNLGEYRVRIAHPDYLLYESEQKFEKAGLRPLRFRLQFPDDTETLVIYGDSEWEGVQRQVLDIEELKAVPGAFGDPIRALQALPSVARPAGFEGDIIIRGAEAVNTGFYFDEMPIPYAFHPFVGKSIVDPALVDDVEFYAGGMPSRFGEVLQGVVNIRTDVKPVTGIRQHVDLNLFDGGYAIETNVRDWEIRSGGRYSWIGGTIGLITRVWSGTLEPLFVPKYWDYSFHADLRDSPSGHWSINLVTTRDLVYINTDFGDSESDDTEEYDLPFNPDNILDAGFLRARVRHRYRGERWQSDSWIAGGPESRQNLANVDLSTQSGITNGRLSGQTFIGRHDSVFEWKEGRRIVGGAQAQTRLMLAEDFSDVYSTDGEVLETKDTQFFGATWAELQTTHGAWKLAPGIRGGFYHFNSQDHFLPEPRLSITRDMSKDLSLKMFVGRFGQAPTLEMTANGFGNPTLGLMKAWQISAGADWKRGPWQVDTSLYGSRMDGLVQKSIGVRYSTQPDGYAYGHTYPYYEATTGYAFGWEGLIRLRPSGPFFGWLSLNLGRSLRIDEAGKVFPANADIPMSVTILAAWNAPGSWNFSTRYRVTSGRPYTELHGVYDAGWDWYQPWTGETNAGRLPAFQQLDVRAEKQWRRPKSEWTIYADVQNLTWAKNPIFASYNYNYTELVTGLYIPLIVLLGVEASF